MPSPIVELLSALGRAFDRLGLRWYLFGAQAALVHGAARLTADVDVTVETRVTELPSLRRALSKEGFELRVTDDEFVQRTHVLPVFHKPSGIPADIVLGGPGLETVFLDRAVTHELDGVQVPVATAEDLIVMKVLGGRAKDIEDVAAILAAQRERLDFEHIQSLLRDIEQALDRSDLTSELERLMERVGLM